MALGPQDWLELAVAAFLVVANGFFVAAEFAIVKIRPTQVEALERAGDRRARIARNVLDNLDAYLGAIQLGITAASLGLGWIGEPALAEIIEPLLTAAGIDSPTVLHSLAFVLAFSIITFAHVVVGELAPKSLAIRHPVDTTRRVAKPLLVFYILSYPFVKVFNGAALLLLRAVGIDPVTPTESLHSEEELESLVSAMSEGRMDTNVTLEVLSNVFWLRRRSARQVMTHRTKVVALDVDDPFEANVRKARESGFVRFPVVEGGLDNVQGVIHLKYLAFRDRAASSRELLSVARPPVVVPETTTLDTALRTLLDAKAKMAIVADEHGGTEGIITMEDILEELVGEIEDAFDQEAPTHMTLPNGRLLVRGDAPLHDLEDVLGLESDEPDVSTVGGLVVARLGYVPRRGEEVLIGGWRLTAVDVTRRRVRELVAERVTFPEADEDADIE